MLGVPEVWHGHCSILDLYSLQIAQGQTNAFRSLARVSNTVDKPRKHMALKARPYILEDRLRILS